VQKALEHVDKRMPKRVKRKRAITTTDGLEVRGSCWPAATSAAPHPAAGSRRAALPQGPQCGAAEEIYPKSGCCSRTLSLSRLLHDYMSSQPSSPREPLNPELLVLRHEP
jgi:hypothetical protein